MLFCSNKFKCILFFPTGCASTFYKKWFYAIHNIIAERPHSLEYYEEFKINWVEVFKKINEDNYKFILLVRNPFTRVYSNLKRKILKNNTFENIYNSLQKSKENNLVNIFNYYKTYIGEDVENINFKNVIDFIVEKNEHGFSVNNSFKPITDLIDNRIFDNKNLNIFKLEDVDTFQNIHALLNLKYINVKYKLLSRSNYRVTGKFSDQEHLLAKIEDNRSIINYSPYYRKNIYNKFKNDFQLFNYDENLNINY